MSKFSDYLGAIARVNGLGNGESVEWLFHCGMLFSSRDKWWGDFQFRHAAHEGIDITYFRTRTDKTDCFDDDIRVPAMDDGVVLNICDDFLGQTLVVGHKPLTHPDSQILFAYSHIIPEGRIKKGQLIKKERVIARVSHTRKNPQLPPHLHFSCFETIQKVQCEHLNWQLFSDSLKVNMIHPVFL